MLLSLHLTPPATLARVGHDRIAGNIPRDLGQLDPLGERPEESENLRPADYPRWLIARQC